MKVERNIFGFSQSEGVSIWKGCHVGLHATSTWPNTPPHPSHPPLLWRNNNTNSSPMSTQMSTTQFSWALIMQSPLLSKLIKDPKWKPESYKESSTPCSNGENTDAAGAHIDVRHPYLVLDRQVLSDTSPPRHNMLHRHKDSLGFSSSSIYSTIKLSTFNPHGMNSWSSVNKRHPKRP